MNIRTLDYKDIAGKYVLLRDDLNVSVENGRVMDDFRIRASLPTIKKLIESGARVAIVAHLGRPDGALDMKYTLAPVADRLAQLLGRDIKFIPDCLDKNFLPDMQDGDVVLLENVRFYAGEEKNDADFSAALARGFDIFVNDGFAVSHRAHASTVGVAKILPAYAGDLLALEIANLSAAVENPARPLVAIVGGAKVSTKIGVLKNLTKIADTLIVGGGIGTAFRIAAGAKINDMLYDPSYRDEILATIAAAEKNGCELLMPIDKGVAKEFDEYAERTDKTFDEIEPDDIILDDGHDTLFRNIAVIRRAKTVLWNGTMGRAEWYPTWSIGTIPLANAIAEETMNGNLASIVGGGDTVAMLDESEITDDMTYVSTGGGAFMEFIEGRTLPGIAVLEI